MKTRACVAMGGGPTRVINRTLFGIVAEAEKNGMEVVAARHGIKGVLEEKFMPISASASPLKEGKDLPGALIGSTRHNPTPEDCARAADLFRKNDIRLFFYIGGNDTSEASENILKGAANSSYEMRIFHVPKTIDNDLVENDHTPGYGSAARFVAHGTLGDDLEVRSLPGIKVNVVMGRHAGWLAAASSLCKKAEDDGPHLIYFPERPKTLAALLADVQQMYERFKKGVVVVSEGLCGPSGNPFIFCPKVREELGKPPFTPILDELVALGRVEEASGGAKRDAFGHVQLSGTGVLGDVLSQAIKIHLHANGVKGARVRADTYGYLARAYAGDVSPVDAREAEMVGRRAVRYALQGKPSGSVALLAERKGRYRATTELIELSRVSGKTREMPDEFINSAGNGVTPAFYDYALPLVGPLARA